MYQFSFKTSIALSNPSQPQTQKNRNGGTTSTTTPRVKASSSSEADVSKNASSVPPSVSTQAPLWGSRTWYFFHTLAEKIKPEEFESVKNELMELIRKICNNLPCPICTAHANEYLSKIKNHNIRTKEDLIELFFHFHNEVNTRKKQPLFEHEQLMIYKSANFLKIYQAFLYYYEDRVRNTNAIANNFHRKRVTSEVMEWMQKNIQKFHV